ncbi:MAG: phosphotransferase [Bacteroidales bacterium]|nr:phosphotransferase [Bacteroidales bacterium]
MYIYYNKLIELFEQYFKVKDTNVEPLPQTASNRQYFRLSSGGYKAVGAYNTDIPENEAFFYITKKLNDAGVNVPSVFCIHKDKHLYLTEDLGNTTLFDYVTQCHVDNRDKEILYWYKKVIDQMPLIQYQAAKGFDFSNCYPREAFDKQSIKWDLNYFKYYFLKLAGVPFHEQKLETDFDSLTDHLLKAPYDFFLFRDFQSRNLMIHNNQIYCIDYQGGRRGALQYDLASLIYDAKVGLTEEQRDEILRHYLEVYSNYSFFSQSEFLKYFPLFILIRLLQAFGAYGYRGYFEQKAFFLHSIPPALKNLVSVLDRYSFNKEIPYLKELLRRLPEYLAEKFPTIVPDQFNLTIFSFSYKKGIPTDYSGNGGGFVFDCRALPNPGKFEKYKGLTGKDLEVINFLEEKNDMEIFINQACNLVAKSIDEYCNRNFEHLMVSFGCTGGQHRSVYCAERMQKIISNKYNININLVHRELEERADDKKHV